MSALLASTNELTLDALAAPAAPGDVFQQLGQITRQLHDTLTELGVMPKLQQAADGLPDARSRLSYIATKTGEAAEKVLTLVDEAKAERSEIARLTQELAEGAGGADPVAAIKASTAAIDAAAGRLDQHLTNIMMAQDFHDLTSQVVAKVVSLAGELEDSLVKLLVQSAPAGMRKTDTSVLSGPVVDFDGRTDVVANQGEVDDLLASLGF